MNGNISPILTGTILNGGTQNRWTQVNANLAVNGFLADFKFTMPSGYTGKWNFLKDIYVNITKRIGSGNGGAVALLSNVSIYSLMSESDYVAGVSMQGTDFTANNICRISGYLDIGYFAMSSRDALEITLNVADRTNFPLADVSFEFSACFSQVQATLYKCYQSTKSTGADQPYKNVLKVAYIGTGVNADAVVNDQIGNKSVNINSAIAMSNAVGRFEFFTNYGLIYEEQFGLSQDLSLRVPTTNNPELLVVTYAFFPEETETSINDTIAQRNALIEQIKNNDSEKYTYLEELGLV